MCLRSTHLSPSTNLQRPHRLHTARGLPGVPRRDYLFTGPTDATGPSCDKCASEYVSLSDLALMHDRGIFDYQVTGSTGHFNVAASAGRPPPGAAVIFKFATSDETYASAAVQNSAMFVAGSPEPSICFAKLTLCSD